MTDESLPATAFAGVEGSVGSPPTLRHCDGCTLCCKIMAVAELNKPSHVWCQHCAVGVGCRIYETRPTPCRTFTCGYLVLKELTAEWKPSLSHLVVVSVSAERMQVMVDPTRPNAWRQQPYYGGIKEWARNAVRENRQILVMIGRRVVVPLPDHDADLGSLAPGEEIFIGQKASAAGLTYAAYAVSAGPGTPAGMPLARLAAMGPGGGGIFREGRRLP